MSVLLSRTRIQHQPDKDAPVNPATRITMAPFQNIKHAKYTREQKMNNESLLVDEADPNDWIKLSFLH